MGEIVAKEKPTTKIFNIELWTNAFLVFSAVYITAHQAQAGDLIKYLHNIRLGAERTTGLGFKSYDEQFRLKRAMNQSMSFGNIDNELWLIYMANPASPNVHATQSNSPNVHAKCYDFNFKGACSKHQCKYIHTCLQCGMQHPLTQQSYQGGRPYNNDYRSFRPRHAWIRPRGLDFGQRGPRPRAQRF